MKYSILTVVALAVVVSAGAAMAQTAVMSTDLSTAVASQPIATVGGGGDAVRIHMLPELPAQAPFDFPPIGGPGGWAVK